jgi:hypothetical protein
MKGNPPAVGSPFCRNGGEPNPARARAGSSRLRCAQEADRRKDEFLAMLGHELRNPLAPISNAVQILRIKGQGDPDLEAVTDAIDRQVRQLTYLVDVSQEAGFNAHLVKPVQLSSVKAIIASPDFRRPGSPALCRTSTSAP